jgi:hypothetical protein
MGADEGWSHRTQFLILLLIYCHYIGDVCGSNHASSRPQHCLKSLAASANSRLLTQQLQGHTHTECDETGKPALDSSVCQQVLHHDPIYCVYWCTKGDEALYNLSPILLFSHSRLLAALFVAKLLDRAELMCRWSGYLSIESRRSWVSTTRKQPSTDRSLTPTDAAVSSGMESSQTSRHAWIKMLMWQHNMGLFRSLVTLEIKVSNKLTNTLVSLQEVLKVTKRD